MYHSLGLWCCLWLVRCCALFTFPRGFNLAFVCLLISFHPFFFIPFQGPGFHFCEALHLDHAVMKRRQFNLVAASPPGMWAMLVQIQAESKSIPVQLIPVRWSKVFQPPGRKRLLLFEAVGVNCLILWHEGQVLNQILLDADFSLFLSLVSLVILPCNCPACTWYTHMQLHIFLL